MANVRMHLHQANDLLVKINNNLSAKNPDSYLEGEKEDLKYVSALMPLVQNELVTNNGNNPSPAFKDALTRLFAERERIINTQLCHTRNSSYPLNHVFMHLATYIDAQKRNSLLFPSVAINDIYFNDFNKLEIGEFIITDNKRQFIMLEDLVNSACERMLVQDRLYETVDEAGNTRPLSELELKRCGNVIRVIDSISKWFQSNHDSCSTLLAMLRDFMLRGDVAHGGEELNAGSEFNVGVIVFYEYYSTMPVASRERLRNFTDGDYRLGHVLDRLFRPADSNYREVRYCIQTLGRLLQGIISANAVELSGMHVGKEVILRNLIRTAKTMLCGHDLDANATAPGRIPGKRELSRLNPKLTFNENEYVVSFVTRKITDWQPFSAKIIVEGVKNGRVFVGSYYIIAKTGCTWPILPDIVQNTKGVFSKVKVFESYGYAQIPQLDSNGGLTISESANVNIKFDQVRELRESLSRSHQVPVENVIDMINSIKSDAEDTEFAYWIYGQNNLTAQQVDAVLADKKLSSLFIQFAAYGRFSIFGSGKDNCVTWCENQLSLAGCGESPVMDTAKAKPIMHVNWL